MKKIDLTPLPDTPEGLHPRDLLRTVLTMASADGLTVDDIRRRLRILDLLDGHENTVLIEDADHATFCQAIRAFKWARAERGILHACDAVLEAATWQADAA